MRTRLAVDPSYILDEGCRFADGGPEVARRSKKEVAEHAKAGPCRDFATPAGGSAASAPITDDDLGLDVDVPVIYDRALQEDETFGVP